MSDINYIITELSLDDVTNHIMTHKKKYLTGALAGLIALGTHHGYNFGKRKFKEHRVGTKQKLLKHKILDHLNKNREAYTGAAVGGLSSIVSSKEVPFSHKLGRGVIGAIGGGLAGSALGNIRKAEELETKLKLNNLEHERKNK